jgi:hypothetical protein
VTSAAERLAALKAKAAGNATPAPAAVAAVAEAPKAELTTQPLQPIEQKIVQALTPAVTEPVSAPPAVVVAPEVSPVADVVPASTAEPKRGRGRPPKAAASVAAINPPETPATPPAPQPISGGPAAASVAAQSLYNEQGFPTVAAYAERGLAVFTHDQLTEEFNRRGYTVATQKAPR